MIQRLGIRTINFEGKVKHPTSATMPHRPKVKKEKKTRPFLELGIQLF
jgi:hypothetical protein